MKAKLKQIGKILPVVLAVLALSLTALVGIGFTKPETAYAEGSGLVKEKLTTPIDANEMDIDQMAQYGYAYYYTGSAEYGPQTLVLDGLNMETAGGTVGEAILFHSGAGTLVLKDGSTNRIKVLASQNSNDGFYHGAIYSYGSLTIQGSGSLIIEYVDQTVNTDMGRILSAFYVKENATFEHTGSITVTTQNLRIIRALDADFSTFNVCNSETGGVIYHSGDLFLNAGSYYSQVGQDETTAQPKAYTMFNTENSNVTLNMTRETGGSIGWTTVNTDQNTLSFYDGSSAPSGIDTSGLSLLGGSSPDSLTKVSTIDDLNGKKSAKVGYAPLHTHTFVYEITKLPTVNETGTAVGFCSDDDGASDTLTLPVLTDASYTKVSHEATSQADAYDDYTYSKNGVILTFKVVHGNTKLHRYVYEVTTQPTATATGTATGTCADGDGATTTLPLPVLTDTAYTKVSHEATSQADAYDDYTYSKDGVTLTFRVVHGNTKLHRYVYEVTTKPTATATGTATGTCAEGDEATTTLTLPVLTDAAYSKVSHAATTEKDAYDTYTYSNDGITLTFDVEYAGTKLPAGGGDNGGDDNGGGNNNAGGNIDGGDKGGLSGGAIAGIAVGSTIGVLLIVYVLGYFLFFAKGKLAGNFFTAIYKPMSKLFKK